MDKYAVIVIYKVRSNWIWKVQYFVFPGALTENGIIADEEYQLGMFDSFDKAADYCDKEGYIWTSKEEVNPTHYIFDEKEN
jgi:hypothetical protein